MSGLLEPYRESANPTRKQDPPMPNKVDDEPSFVIEEIVDSRWYGPKGACSKYRLLKGLAQDVDLLNFFFPVDVASDSR